MPFFGRSALKGVGIDIGEPQNWGALGPATLGWGRGLPRIRTSPLQICVITSNVVVLRQRT